MDYLTQEELIQQAQAYLATCPKWSPDKSKCQGCKTKFSITHNKYLGCVFCDEDWDLPELVSGKKL
jgi:hypothetical protein